ncbi:MAG TPA: alpha/beta fold hydrolase [Burkholderiaceae bacterium]
MSSYDEPVSIEIDRENRIAGTLVTPGTLVPGVLFVHGWGGSQEQYLARAREVAALGCMCLTFDLRGHAQTRRQFETVSRALNLADVLAAYDTLVKRRHVDASAIAVVGSSYGGYLATILSTMRPVKWLALRAPALYLDSGWDVPKLQLHRDQDLPTYRSSIVAAAGNKALTACQSFEGDVLLVQSEHDDIIPVTVLTSYREAFRKARSLTYRCLAGADHGLTGERDQRAYSTVLVNWLQEMLAGARAGTVVAHDAKTEPSATPEVPPHASKQAA